MANILVIDDCENMCALIAAQLGDGGHDVTFETVPEEGIERAARDLPDVILLDVRMPSLDGPEACAILKDREATRRIPVIMTSVMNDAKQIERALAAGATDYVTKPIVPELLLARIESAVRGGRKRGEPVVSQFMTGEVRTASPATELRRAIEIMAREGVSSLVIVNEDSKPLGAIDGRDVVHHLAAGVSFDAQIGDLGSVELAAIPLDMRLGEAASAATDSGRKQVAILDEKGGVAGLITSTDMLRAYADMMEHRLQSTNRALERRTEELVEVNRRLIAQSRESDRVRRELESELEAARRMQLASLPGPELLESIRARTGIDISVAYRPCRPVGGDGWWVEVLPDDRLAVYVVDFTGHGVNAAVNTFRFHTLMTRDEARETQPDPAAHLAYLNAQLCGLLPTGTFAAAVYGVVDLAAARFVYSACGATEPIVLDRAGAVATGDPEGLVLGVAESAEYENRELPLAPGSLLALYTDALVESPSPRGDCLTSRDLAGKLARRRREHGSAWLARGVAADFLDSIGGSAPDDLTLMCVQVPD